MSAEVPDPPWMPKVGDKVVIIFGDGASATPVTVVECRPGWRFLLGDGGPLYVDKHITALQPAPASAAAPRKPIELTITVNGFSWDEALHALSERAGRLERNHELGAGVSACGYGASHTADVQLREVSREQFGDESIAWLEAQRDDR